MVSSQFACWQSTVCPPRLGRSGTTTDRAAQRAEPTLTLPTRAQQTRIQRSRVARKIRRLMPSLTILRERNPTVLAIATEVAVATDATQGQAKSGCCDDSYPNKCPEDHRGSCAVCDFYAKAYYSSLVFEIPEVSDWAPLAVESRIESPFDLSISLNARGPPASF